MTEQKGRYYDLPAHERDRMIVELKQRGWNNVRIAKQVGMTESGVRRSIDRIRAGGGNARGRV